jgi:hypothetical protein
MNKQNNASVQKHRAKMAAEGYARFEVTIGSGMIDRAREIARQTGWPLWRVIEEALEAYVITGNPAADNAAETGNGK